ncbi:unnamed protein product, partial [Mesorhabditis spiculigera]
MSFKTTEQPGIDDHKIQDPDVDAFQPQQGVIEKPADDRKGEAMKDGMTCIGLDRRNGDDVRRDSYGLYDAHTGVDVSESDVYPY